MSRGIFSLAAQGRAARLKKGGQRRDALLIADGHFNPEVVKYRQLCFKSQYKRYLSSQQQYFYRLLKQILASRNVSYFKRLSLHKRYICNQHWKSVWSLLEKRLGYKEL